MAHTAMGSSEHLSPGVSIQDGDMRTGFPAEGGSLLAPGTKRLGVWFRQQICQNILCPAGSLYDFLPGSWVLAQRKQVYPTHDFSGVGKHSSHVFLVH